MSAQTHSAALEALTAAVAAERVHTVRVCFADHYGVLRGRRLAAERFVEGVATPQAFCDGALVWDIRCDIFEGTRFSNYRTGYPDLLARPDLDTLGPLGWVEGEWIVLSDAHDAHGHPIEVDPRRVLQRVLERLEQPVEVGARLELRVPDDAVARAWAPGHAPPFAEHLVRGLRATGVPLTAVEWVKPQRLLRLTMSARSPLATADALVLARTAAREVSGAHGVRLTAMPRVTTEDAPATLAVELERPPDARLAAATRRLGDVALLLRPLPLAYAPREPDLAEPRADRWSARAASDGNPYLAIAGALAAAWADADGDAGAPPGDLGTAARRLRDSAWAGSWLRPEFVHDAVALAEREAGLRASAISPWDLERYWESG